VKSAELDAQDGQAPVVLKWALKILIVVLRGAGPRVRSWVYFLGCLATAVPQVYAYLTLKALALNDEFGGKVVNRRV
jgi:hypothetical protein